MAFRLHVLRDPERQTIEAMGRLSGVHRGADNMVFLVRSSHADEGYFLMATDGVVVRTQAVRLFWSLQALTAHHLEVGPCTADTPLSCWVSDTGSGPLPDLSKRPARLLFVPEDLSWDLAFQDEEDPIVKSTASSLLYHLRPIPTSFRSWFYLVHASAMAQFAATFPPELEPPILWIPEAQPDPSKPLTAPAWAKYWAFHAKTEDPLGVILGVRSPETLSRFREHPNI